MKNLLLASTALVATAGFASADIALSGMAEMGIVGGSATETQFHTDVDVTFTMTGTADNGLTFGASIDLDESTNGNAFGTSTEGGETIFVAFGGFRLTMGDTDGAYDAALAEASGGGASIADDHTSHAGFDGQGGGVKSGFDDTYGGTAQVARFQYTAAGFTGHLSVEIDDTGAGDPVWGLGVQYSTDLSGTALGVGLGYQTVGNRDVWGISLSATMANGLSAVVQYSSENAAAGGVDHFGIGLGYTMNALSIGANYGEFSDGREGWGFAASYALGDGLSAQMGYGSTNGGADTWSLGLAMSF